jgi:outer membrane protein TolC
VASQVAKAYLAALRAKARVETARANIELAEELLELAENQKAAGTGTGIDVTRAKVQLSSERQSLLVAENDLRRARLELLRAMDLRLETEVELTDRLAYHPVDLPGVEGAIESALEARADWKAQAEREERARLGFDATRWERLPSASVYGDYGAIGPGVSNAFPTRTVGFRVDVPVFDGGRVDKRRAEAGSLLRQERIRTADLRTGIDLEIRLALDGLRSAAERVGVADESVELSENELAQARRRFAGGVATSVEVTDAQNRLARARDTRIAAVFQYEAARLDLGAAVGRIREYIQ